MKSFDELLDGMTTRKEFLAGSAKVAAAATLFPLIGCSADEEPPLPPLNRDWVTLRLPQNREKITVGGVSPARVLLKNGLIVDGTGGEPYYGDVLINGNRLELVTPKEIIYAGRAIDCAGMAVAPGFIDAHSHMDWTLPIQGQSQLKTPFTEQGICTVVTGNCGHGVAAFRPGSSFREMIQARTTGLFSINWDSMAEYFMYQRRVGLSHNMVNLAGHGTTRMSMRGYNPAPMSPDEMREMLRLLEEAMEQGAHGVSLGLQYEPGIFATLDELKAVARLVKSKNKILTSHMKAYSALSGTYPLKLFGRHHNLLAIDDMLEIARETEVRMQLSHLIFVGSKTFKNCPEALALIDGAINQGLDVMFDTYAYHCGTSVINVFFPEWFLARAPEVYNDTWAMIKLRAELELIVQLLGFGYSDIQIINAIKPELSSYNGLFLKTIAEQRGLGQFENFVDIARASEGRARVLNHRYSSLENVKELMKHRAALFMTDATTYLQGAQNPASYGNFPRFLQLARDFRLLTIQETIRKMTGASAERFNLSGRGFLREGFAADVTVFDWNEVKDNNTLTETNRKPSGINHVFINGREVVSNGAADGSINAGVII